MLNVKYSYHILGIRQNHMLNVSQQKKKSKYFFKYYLNLNLTHSLPYVLSHHLEVSLYLYQQKHCKGFSSFLKEKTC